MCGLVGMAGAIAVKHEDMFKDLLRLDVLRGPHSTGIASVSANGDVMLTKRALLPDDLLQLQGSKNQFLAKNHVLIGHNRYATKGAVNTTNAHPFEMNTIVGAHNGTVQQYNLPDFKDFAVDSENVFHSIEKIGIKETVSKLDGAFALSFYDKEEENLHLVRNKERPLHYVFTEEDNVLIWASEAWMLHVASSRNGVKLKDVMELPVGVLITADPFGKVNEYKTEELTLLKKPIGKTTTPATTGWHGTRGLPNKTTLPFDKRFKVGDKVVFSIDTTSKIGASSVHVVGLREKDNWYVSFYLNFPRDQVMLELMHEDDEAMFSGIITGFRSSGGCSPKDMVFVEPTSVKKLSSVKPVPIYTSNGYTISKAVFDNKSLTDACCTWCGDPLDFKDKPYYIGKNGGRLSFVCESCEQQAGVKEFIN